MSTPEKDESKGKYKSPPRKLARFFEKSRNSWKEKYISLRYKTKLLLNQVRYLKSRNSELTQQNKELKKALEASKKNIIRRT